MLQKDWSALEGRQNARLPLFLHCNPKNCLNPSTNCSIGSAHRQVYPIPAALVRACRRNGQSSKTVDFSPVLILDAEIVPSSLALVYWLKHTSILECVHHPTSIEVITESLQLNPAVVASAFVCHTLCANKAVSTHITYQKLIAFRDASSPHLQIITALFCPEAFPN